MKIAIIGGSGFIGTILVNRLINKKKNVLIVDKQISKVHPEFYVNADIRDVNSLKCALKGVDLVINLAAEHRDDVTPKSLYDDVNVEGAKNLCKVCEELKILKIIFTSSVAVYGFAPIGTDESGKIDYFNDYGRTKWEAEEVYREWFGNGSNNKILTIIRPTVVFGERNRGNVYNLLKQISSGLFPMIGLGRNLKSMAYVENVAAFIDYCSEINSGYGVYNYIDKPDFTMNSLVKHVKKSLGKKPTTGFHWPYFLGLFVGYIFDFFAFITKKKLSISSIRIKKFCANTMFEPANLNKTNFIPPISIEDGIERTVKFEFFDKENTNEILFYTE